MLIVVVAAVVMCFAATCALAAVRGFVATAATVHAATFGLDHAFFISEAFC